MERVADWRMAKNGARPIQRVSGPRLFTIVEPSSRRSSSTPSAFRRGERKHDHSPARSPAYHDLQAALTVSIAFSFVCKNVAS